MTLLAMARALLAALALAATSATVLQHLDDTSALMQQATHRVNSDAIAERMDKAMNDMKMGLSRFIHVTTDVVDEATQDFTSEVEAERVSLLEEGAVQFPLPVPTFKPIKEQIAGMETRLLKRMNKAVNMMSKGINRMNTMIEKKAGKAINVSSSAVDDMQAGAQAALSSMELEEATESKNRTASIDKNAHIVMAKVNKAFDEMKGGMQELAKSFEDSMREAGATVARHLSRTVEDHVREELESALNAEAASLLELGTAHTAVSKVHTAAYRALDSVQDFLESTGKLHIDSATAMDGKVKLGEALYKAAESIADMKNMITNFADDLHDSLAKVGGSLTSS